MFIPVSACVFLALFGFWETKGLLNIAVKLGMLGLGIWGIYLWLK